MNELFLSGKSTNTDIYNTDINLLNIEHYKCEDISISQTKIEKYKLYFFTHSIVNFDTEKLAISDYSRFIKSADQTKKMVSEIYHIFVLKSAKSIKSNSKINYEITKATSYGIAFIFGYFYKPFFVVLWMIVFIFIFAFIYMGLFNLNFENAIFNSGFTFLTIGFLENNETRTLLETTLMLSEGIIGITYTATLLTSIINSTRKQ